MNEARRFIKDHEDLLLGQNFRTLPECVICGICPVVERRVERRNAMVGRRRKSSVLFILVQLYCLLLSGVIGITLGLLMVALLMPDHPIINELRAALNSFYEAHK